VKTFCMQPKSARNILTHLSLNPARLTTLGWPWFNPRIHRFSSRLIVLCFEIVHVPDRALIVADTLSRAPVNTPTAEDKKAELADCFLSMQVKALSSRVKRIAD